MLPNTLAALLKLSAKDRVEIAMALWESLTDAEREAELVLTPEQKAELDRRLVDHLANPNAAIPWEEVRGSSRARRDATPRISVGSRIRAARCPCVVRGTARWTWTYLRRSG
jgi:putative addiction module component (TIGR02574 family)